MVEHGGTLTGQTGLLFPTSILTISPSQTVTLRKAALAQPMSAIHVEAVKDKGVAVIPCFQSYLISQWPPHSRHSIKLRGRLWLSMHGPLLIHKCRRINQVKVQGKNQKSGFGPSTAQMFSYTPCQAHV